jgi:hypothetical protein
MGIKVGTNDRSLSIVQRLLENSYVKEKTIAVVQRTLSTESSSVRFDEKGSTRVEILFDTVVRKKTDNTVRIHGLAENCHEERAPIVFYCKSSWVNDEKKHQNNESSDASLKSFVIDPEEKPSAFNNTDFSVIFENKHDGTLLGTGEGYLRFEKDRSQTL